MYPGYFAMVMATGIVSTAAWRLGLRGVSAPLLWMAAAYIVLLALYAVRVVRFGPRLVAHLLAPRTAFTFSRFLWLIGGTIISFYDWYCDLPIASPLVWGEQTDVPESADWWNSGYLSSGAATCGAATCR